MSGATLDNLSTESRSFPPPDGFAEQANATKDWYERADADREGFWAEQADRLTWTKKWDQVLDWQPPFAKWFVGGTLNVAYNCVDRRATRARSPTPACSARCARRRTRWRSWASGRATGSRSSCR